MKKTNEIENMRHSNATSYSAEIRAELPNLNETPYFSNFTTDGFRQHPRRIKIPTKFSRMSVDSRHQAESPKPINISKSNIPNIHVSTSKSKNVDYLMKQFKQNQSDLSRKIRVRISLKPNGFSYLPEPQQMSLMSAIQNQKMKRPRKRRRSKVAESMLIM